MAPSALPAHLPAPTDDAPAETPKRRDLSKPSYRSEALHRLLSTPPKDAAPATQPQLSYPAAAAAGPGTAPSGALPPGRPASAQRGGVFEPMHRGSSAPVSPLRSGSAAGSRDGAAGGSAPASPLVAGPRLNRAASVRAAAAQRKLQEQEERVRAVMARSPDRWLRAAAAEGLSLRQAAVFVSPGKSARPHYQPSPAMPSQPTAQRAAAGAGGASLRAATPGASRFDAFAAGEAGVEPYSARLHTVERRQMAAAQRGPAPGAGAGAGRAEVAAGGALDFDALAAERDAYLRVSEAWCGALFAVASRVLSGTHMHMLRQALKARRLASIPAGVCCAVPRSAADAPGPGPRPAGVGRTCSPAAGCSQAAHPASAARGRAGCGGHGGAGRAAGGAARRALGERGGHCAPPGQPGGQPGAFACLTSSLLLESRLHLN